MRASADADTQGCVGHSHLAALRVGRGGAQDERQHRK